MSHSSNIFNKKIKQLGSLFILSASLFCSVNLAQAEEQGELNVEQAIKLCQEGDINQCNLLANSYLANHQYAEAAKYLHKVCYAQTEESFRVCAGLSTILINPSYGIEDYEQGKEIAGYLCDHDYAYGCNLLSDMYFKGQSTEVDLEAALKYGKKSCDLSDPTGCSQAGLVTYAIAYLEKDIPKAEQAFQYYKKACDLGDNTACKEFAEAQSKLEAFEIYVQNANQNAQVTQ